MFTGIIVELGKVVSIQSTSEGARLCISCPEIIRDSQVGDSISVNGVCLTITEIKDHTAFFDVSQQTLNLTTTGSLRVGDRVNLEPALRVNSRLGGHLVSGHVEGVGRIVSKKISGNSERIEIEAPQSIIQYAIPKGSIAVDGISLTVVEVSNKSFTVVIIPHTLKMTTLGFKKVGDAVNLEADMIAKYVAHFVTRLNPKDKDEGLLGALQRSGFV